MRLIIFFGIMLLSGCGKTIYEQEHEAFSKMIDAKVAAKQMSLEEAEYLKTKNYRETSNAQSKHIQSALDSMSGKRVSVDVNN